MAKHADGTLVLVDWKRSKGLAGKYHSPYGVMNGGLNHLPDAQGVHYRLQLNLYRHMLETLYGYRVSRMLVVCCHPELQEPFVDEVPEMDRETSVLLADQESRVLEARASVQDTSRQAVEEVVSVRRGQVIEVRLPGGKRRLVVCPARDSAVALYEWVSAAYRLAPRTFVITHRGVSITADWQPSERVTVVVMLKPRIRGALGMCMVDGALYTDSQRKRRMEDHGDVHRPTSRCRMAETPVRLLLDTGADVHACPPWFNFGCDVVEGDTGGSKHAVVDAQGGRKKIRKNDPKRV